ncbi:MULTISPECIES: dienelactone hydrolase [unclassified Rhizobium]|uniref:alpha/beta hydrolase family protein n=1 Tax=unclassified Rhizobium TaxID=2613769 RepID=UPI001A991DA5|nr:MULTISPECIES: dienelactone hydrolase [unclassified Rhizobium]MBX5155862.1 dienelactone hydrolase [Rhizobium sp. NZLR8]MBX5164188.1 dienelactone hydrolase [Rhizobium sp. NZLR4b]MBX5169740.1 dienelactone hydrolase [Rhizobium sp. NZLR1b]MBX5184410.1 dienelactone hydrolase [Rhizobium sp. NZLR5]MBX5191138.1 dienelactone hydrolase [Rhizobium sp. NZLR3b]
MNNLINLASHIPTPDATLTVAYTPIRLPMEGRQPLELRLTAPATGSHLPIVLVSHGFGPSNYLPSKDGYAPLAQFWAERGFAVIQPTHASSRVGGLPAGAPGAPFFWRERVEELKAVIEQLVEVEHQAPAVSGRLDHSRIAAAGHSFGGHTVGLLLGARVDGEDFSDPRISAGILLAAPGRGGKDMTEENASRFPFFDVDFSSLTTLSLVVCGDQDDPHFTPRGPEWHADAFQDGPGAEALLMLREVGHGLGGIAGLDARETETEAPDVLEATKRLTLAWLQTALAVDEHAWVGACGALEGLAAPIGHVTRRTH